MIAKPQKRELQAIVVQKPPTKPYYPRPVYTTPKVCTTKPSYTPVIVTPPRVVIQRTPVVIQSPPTVVAAPAAPLEQPRQQVMSGDTLTLQAGSLGDRPGRVVIQAGRVALRAEIMEWKDSYAKIRMPSLNLDEPLPAELKILKATGKLAGAMPIEMIPAEANTVSIRLTRDPS